MKRIGPFVAEVAMAIGATATPAHAATVVRNYVAAPHDSMAWATVMFTTRVDINVICSRRPHAPDVGGACVTLPAGATSVDVQIRDRRMPLVGGRVWFLDDAGAPRGLGKDVCGAASVAIPRNASAVYVTVGDYYACGRLAGGLGTTGRVFFNF